MFVCPHSSSAPLLQVASVFGDKYTVLLVEDDQQREEGDASSASGDLFYRHLSVALIRFKFGRHETNSLGLGQSV